MFCRGSFLFLVCRLTSILAWSPSINSIFSYEMLTDDSLLAESVGNGIQAALEECKLQFQWDRWNCPDHAFSRRGRQIANRETAYVVAMTAAGVVHSVARNCSQGDLPHCNCSTFPSVSHGEGWRWAGCSDDVDYGDSVARSFLDTLESGVDAQAYVNLHNNRVGRMEVKNNLKKQCKCHGVSGSCTVRTCWMQVPTLSQIGALLKERYHQALRVDYDGKKGELSIGNSVSGTRVEELSKLEDNILLFLEDSPDYCIVNNTTGWNGTMGRLCSRKQAPEMSAEERRSCKTLCRSCGHRVRRRRRQVLQHCNCQFHWCCEVTCDICKQFVNEHFCD